MTGRSPLRRSGPPAGTKTGATPTGGLPQQVWEGEKGKLHLNIDFLLDEDWQQVQPHWKTLVKCALLGQLLVAPGYDASSTHYLVEGFRQGFHLRLDKPSTR